MLAIARAGAAAGCTEALFTLGDKPELRYAAAREALARLGHIDDRPTWRDMCALVLRETGLLPHANPGVMTREEIAGLREVTASQGIMLESTAERLCERGGPHFGSPDKLPAARLETIRLAGELAVPFTTGILIGIGETRGNASTPARATRCIARYGHLQEIIIQNFRAKPGTRMAVRPDAGPDDLKWTIAMARLMFGPAMNIQAPPNLSPDALEEMIAAGINDWGGVSPVTPDHVNPEAPWPRSSALRERSRRGRQDPGRTADRLSGVCARACTLDRSALCTPQPCERCRELCARDRLGAGLAGSSRTGRSQGRPDRRCRASRGRQMRLDAGAIVDLFEARGG